MFTLVKVKFASIKKMIKSYDMFILLYSKVKSAKNKDACLNSFVLSSTISYAIKIFIKIIFGYKCNKIIKF